MAGLAEPLLPRGTATGPFSTLARAQYFALARMRWSMFRHGMRSTQGAVELGARGVMILLYSVMGVGMAFGLGAAGWAVVAHNEWELLPIFFWAVFLLWQIVPVSIASFQQQFDLGGLLRFPVSFSAFYLLHLVFGLVDISTIMGSFCCAGIWFGITLARPGLFLWAALSLFAFAIFNILLGRAIFAWIDRWLAQRRTREIVSAIFFLMVLSANLLNPAFRANPKGNAISKQTQAAGLRYLRMADRVQRWLPPGLAARGLRNGAHAQPARAAESFGLLGIYVLVAGGVLGVRLRGEYRGENFGEAPSRKRVERRSRRWLLDGSGPISAVVEKELRVLVRALPLLYGLAAPLIMVFVFSGLFRIHGASAFANLPWGLLICFAYSMVGFTQLLYNNLGTEGAGIQILFLSPTPIRTVVLAKNIFHAAVFGVDVLLVGVLASLRYGPPSPIAVVSVAAWLVFALPVHLAAGNAFSIIMPYRVNMGRISRQKGSQANALLSLAVQVGTLSVGAAVFALSAYFNRLWLSIPVFLFLAVAAVFAWLHVLSKVDVMANQRRDELIAILLKAE